MTKVDTNNINKVFEVKIFRDLSKIANDCGFEIYVVGGYVRDLFLGKEVKDIDFTIVGDALEFAQKVADYYNTKAVIYERFRTALVPISDLHLEFVGTRKEEYDPKSRNPIVSNGTLKDDIYRRDFTINALAISLNENNFGELVDMLGGVEDLKNEILRTPLDPYVTFDDDPLRMMRCIRFAAKLNFEIQSELLEVISKLKNRIKIISQERITDELIKIMSSPKPSVGFYHLYNTGLLEIIFPEVYNLAGVDIISNGHSNYAHKDVFKHTLKVLDNICSETDNVWLRFAALLHDIAKPKTKKFVEGIGWTFYGHEEVGARWVKRIFKTLKLPFHHIEYVEKLVRLHQRPMVLVEDIVTDSALRRLAAHAGSDLEDLLTLCKADITTRDKNKVQKYLNNYEVVKQKILEVQEKDKLREFQSPVRGETIMEICQISPSRIVGIIKNNIEEAILEGIIPNEYDAAFEYFMNNKDNWIQEFSSKM